MSVGSHGPDGLPKILANTDEQVARLTLSELNHQISWTKVRAMRAGDKRARAVINRRLTWLVGHRERMYGYREVKTEDGLST